MPYYCTVPRCTSMAGKAKNVSFHQFPRDEELAALWNRILRRGKPYTKYSKVCSLHFTPDDYTMTSGQKNKGQWRTLRKDAIPSRNLPTDSPLPQQQRSSTWSPPSNVIDARMHQQMAQAIYVQTMLAMQAAGINAVNNEQQSSSEDIQTQSTHTDECEENIQLPIKSDTFQCTECSKCFKDPDVYVLHKRTHKHDNNEEMLRANPILANLLKSDQKNDSNDVKNIKIIENQIMAALTANMENYLRNLSTIMLSTHGNTDSENGSQDSNCDNEDFDSTDSKLVIDEDS